MKRFRSVRFPAACPFDWKRLLEALRDPVEIEVIDPGPACCRACGGDLVESAGCAVCGVAGAPEGAGIDTCSDTPAGRV